MKLSIIILNWNSHEHLVRCLRSLDRCTIPHQLIVVDNASQDGSLGLLEDLKQRGLATVLFNSSNLGVGPARNRAFRVAEGEYLLSLDVDTEVQPGAIEELVQLMDANSQIGICSARLHGKNGELQYTCRELPTVQSKLARQMPSSIGERILAQSEMRSWDHLDIRDVGYVIGACQMIRRKALDEVGPYDPEIFYGPEDVDLCLRMWKMGWRITYDGRAVVLHHERRITKRMSQIFSRPTWNHALTLIYYFRKHAYLFKPPFKVQECTGDQVGLRPQSAANG